MKNLYHHRHYTLKIILLAGSNYCIAIFLRCFFQADSCTTLLECIMQYIMQKKEKPFKIEGIELNLSLVRNFLRAECWRKYSTQESMH